MVEDKVKKDEEKVCSFCGVSHDAEGVTLIKSGLSDKKVCNLCISEFAKGISSKEDGVIPVEEFNTRGY